MHQDYMLVESLHMDKPRLSKGILNCIPTYVGGEMNLSSRASENMKLRLLLRVLHLFSEVGQCEFYRFPIVMESYRT